MSILGARTGILLLRSKMVTQNLMYLEGEWITWVLYLAVDSSLLSAAVLLGDRALLGLGH